jgi:hypothetical protein
MAKRDPKLAKSRLEALLSIATGAAAEPLAGIAGLYGAATGGAGEGVRNYVMFDDSLIKILGKK